MIVVMSMLNVSVWETVVVPEAMAVLSMVSVLVVVDDKSVLTVVTPVCVITWEELDRVVVVE